jgi:RHS repeat-associated protein
VSPTGSNQLFDDLTLLPFNPQQVRLTTYDGRIIDFDRDDGIVRLEDRNGNELFITDDGITHSSGKSITFDRDALGRIERIVDPMGLELHYAYDVNGDLVRVTDRENDVSTFGYDQRHHLIDVIDPLGHVTRREYDAAGRLIAVVDALGNRLELGHDLPGRLEAVRNRAGEITVLVYDLRGNIVREDYVDGSFRLRTFDANDNVASTTDELGRTTAFTYDAFSNKLSEVNALGETKLWSYDAKGRVTSETDGAGATTIHAYDEHGNLRFTTDPEGFVTEQRFDASGSVVFRSNGRGDHWTFAYDSDGFLARETDPRGTPIVYVHDTNGIRMSETSTRTVGSSVQTLTTRYTSDGEGRITSVEYPDGATARFDFDALGRMIGTTDELGRSTVREYDPEDRETKRMLPDGTFEERSYDPEGRLIRTRDRSGREVVQTLDGRGRPVVIASSAGTIIQEHNVAGELVARIDRRGHRTEYGYDATGRQVLVRDPLLHETVHTYDSAGRLRTTTDAKGRTTTFEYDRRGLRTRILHPDGTERRFAFDGAGNLIEEADEEGHTVQRSHDPAGNLLATVDENGSTWAFAFDEVGNRVAAVDPNAHATTFTFDPRGRESRRTLADGLFRQQGYDARGNLISRASYSGALTTFQYDASDRLARRVHPDLTSVEKTYEPLARPFTTIDARGITVSRYDASGRIDSVTHPDGTALSFDFDAAGNLTSRTLDAGGSRFVEAFEYNERDELVSVSTGGLLFRLFYDATGQLARVDHPNGLTTAYGYDGLDRLTSIVTTRSSGAVVSSHIYARHGDGRVATVTEADQSLHAFDYDPANRLVQAVVTSSTGATIFAEGYAYDPAGNRITRFHTPAGGVTEQFDATFDARDRLVSEGVASYAFDADGRAVSRTGTDGFTLAWDSEDRLLQIAHEDGTVVDNAYDADGVLVERTIARPGGVVDARRLVVDTRLPLSQVIAEIDAATHQVVARYVYAEGRLLAIVRPTGVRFVHADLIGSTRHLTDAAGTITDSYAYDPYGVLVSHQGTDENPFLFAGEYTPASLAHHRARWYEPSTGRFLSIDPFDGVSEEQASLHGYLYAENDPITVADASGLFACFSNRALGQLAHARLQDQFEREMPGAVTRRTIGRGVLRVPALGHLRLLPDLIALYPAMVWEIKPANPPALLAGVKQLEAYLDVLNFFDPYRNWHRGVGWPRRPPLVMSISTEYFIVAQPVWPGLIGYCPVDKRAAVGVGALGFARYLSTVLKGNTFQMAQVRLQIGTATSRPSAAFGL